MDIEECLKLGYLTKIKPDEKLVSKELGEAEYDLGKACHALEEEDMKWCIIKSYYSIFHSARAVLFALGYKERKHIAVQTVLEDLAKQGKLESIYTEYFSSAMDFRENADYRYQHSKERAEETVKWAQKFLDRMKQLLEKL